MTEKAAANLSIRACRLEDRDVLLELWRQAEATPGVTDNAEDLRRAIADSPAHVLVAEVEGRLVGSVIGTFDGWRGNIYRLAVHPDYRRQGLARAAWWPRSRKRLASSAGSQAHHGLGGEG